MTRVITFEAIRGGRYGTVKTTGTGDTLGECIAMARESAEDLGWSEALFIEATPAIEPEPDPAIDLELLRTARKTAREINSVVRDGGSGRNAYHVPLDSNRPMRVIAARTRTGRLFVRLLATGAWVEVAPSDSIVISL